tara:strand:+ start:44 stop:337 length:294 start_codon:yes stop_codon:yes gene_type:complete
MKKTLTKRILASRINTKLGYSKEESKEFIDVFFDSIKNNLLKEKQIKISKLGTFNLIRKKQRIGRNPKTGEEAIISERNVVSFRFSRLIKEIINKKQ